MALDFKIISLEDDLQTLVDQIKSARWEDENGAEEYAVDAVIGYTFEFDDD